MEFQENSSKENCITVFTKSTEGATRVKRIKTITIIVLHIKTFLTTTTTNIIIEVVVVIIIIIAIIEMVKCYIMVKSIPRVRNGFNEAADIGATVSTKKPIVTPIVIAPSWLATPLKINK